MRLSCHQPLNWSKFFHQHIFEHAGRCNPSKFTESREPFAMSMSPAGKLLVVAGYPGLQIFHFNGAAPPTTFSSWLLSSVDIDQVKWDSNKHLYALNYNAAQLYVFTVTPTSITETTGSPYNLPSYPYKTRSTVVIP